MSCFALCIKLFLPEQFDILWNEALQPASVWPLSWHLGACFFLFMLASLWSPSIQAPKQQLPLRGQWFRTDELVKLSTIVAACWPWQILDQSSSKQTSHSRHQNVSDCCPWTWHMLHLYEVPGCAYAAFTALNHDSESTVKHSDFCVMTVCLRGCRVALFL